MNRRSLLLKVEWFGFLRLVWMLRAGIHKKLLVHGTAKLGFWQHTLYSALNNLMRLLVQHGSRCSLALTSWITGVIEVNLILHFVSGKAQLIRVDDNHIVAGINIRCITRLVLASQRMSNLGAEAAYDFPFSIDDKPLTGYIRRIWRLSAIT